MEHWRQLNNYRRSMAKNILYVSLHVKLHVHVVSDRRCIYGNWLWCKCIRILMLDSCDKGVPFLGRLTVDEEKTRPLDYFLCALSFP